MHKHACTHTCTRTHTRAQTHTPPKRMGPLKLRSLAAKCCLVCVRVHMARSWSTGATRACPRARTRSRMRSSCSSPRNGSCSSTPRCALQRRLNAAAAHVVADCLACTRAQQHSASSAHPTGARCSALTWAKLGCAFVCKWARSPALSSCQAMLSLHACTCAHVFAELRQFWSGEGR